MTSVSHYKLYMQSKFIKIMDCISLMLPQYTQPNSYFFPDGTNFALFRPAWQSTTSGGNVAGKAVDGNEKSITHTLDFTDFGP